MRWYRSVYKSAIASWPHYEAAIRKCADSDLLLMDEADLERAVLSGQITKAQSDAYFAIIREIP
jgi:predicted RNA-binding protein associated with RNAse of E/G family